MAISEYQEAFAFVVDECDRLAATLEVLLAAPAVSHINWYRVAKGSELALPRAYLLLVVGRAYLSAPLGGGDDSNGGQSPIAGFARREDLFEDVRVECSSVQEPVRGLYVRQAAAYMLRSFLHCPPQGGAPAASRWRLSLGDTVVVLLDEFALANRLFVRLSPALPDNPSGSSHASGRGSLHEIVAGPIRSLAKLSSAPSAEGACDEEQLIGQHIYCNYIVPTIVDHLVACRDAVSQQYIVGVLLDAFPVALHMASIDCLLDGVTSFALAVNIRSLSAAIINRLLGSADGAADSGEYGSGHGSALQPPVSFVADGKAFDRLWERLSVLLIERLDGDRPSDALMLATLLLSHGLAIVPFDAARLDRIFAFFCLLDEASGGGAPAVPPSDDGRSVAGPTVDSQHGRAASSQRAAIQMTVKGLASIAHIFSLSSLVDAIVRESQQLVMDRASDGIAMPAGDQADGGLTTLAAFDDAPPLIVIERMCREGTPITTKEELSILTRIFLSTLRVVTGRRPAKGDACTPPDLDGGRSCEAMAGRAEMVLSLGEGVFDRILMAAPAGAAEVVAVEIVRNGRSVLAALLDRTSNGDIDPLAVVLCAQKCINSWLVLGRAASGDGRHISDAIVEVMRGLRERLCGLDVQPILLHSTWDSLEASTIAGGESVGSAAGRAFDVERLSLYLPDALFKAQVDIWSRCIQEWSDTIGRLVPLAAPPFADRGGSSSSTTEKSITTLRGLIYDGLVESMLIYEEDTVDSRMQCRILAGIIGAFEAGEGALLCHLSPSDASVILGRVYAHARRILRPLDKKDMLLRLFSVIAGRRQGVSDEACRRRHPAIDEALAVGVAESCSVCIGGAGCLSTQAPLVKGTGGVPLLAFADAFTFTRLLVDYIGSCEGPVLSTLGSLAHAHICAIEECLSLYGATSLLPAAGGDRASASTKGAPSARAIDRQMVDGLLGDWSLLSEAIRPDYGAVKLEALSPGPQLLEGEPLDCILGSGASKDFAMLSISQPLADEHGDDGGSYPVEAPPVNGEETNASAFATFHPDFSNF